jgi:hypothetical protein
MCSIVYLWRATSCSAMISRNQRPTQTSKEWHSHHMCIPSPIVWPNVYLHESRPPSDADLQPSWLADWQMTPNSCCTSHRGEVYVFQCMVLMESLPASCRPVLRVHINPWGARLKKSLQTRVRDATSACAVAVTLQLDCNVRTC